MNLKGGKLGGNGATMAALGAQATIFYLRASRPVSAL